MKKQSPANILKKKIIDKFGTFSKFCELAGIDRYEGFQKFFAAYGKKVTPERTEYLKKLSELCSKTSADKQSKSELSEDELKSIKLKIEQAGGRVKFCEDHKKFNPTSVYKIMNGDRLKKSRIVKELLKALGL